MFYFRLSLEGAFVFYNIQNSTTIVKPFKLDVKHSNAIRAGFKYTIKYTVYNVRNTQVRNNLRLNDPESLETKTVTI